MNAIQVKKFGKSIFIIYSYSNEKFKVFTGIRVSDHYWDGEHIRKNLPNEDSLVLRLAHKVKLMNRSIIAIQEEGNEPSVERVKVKFNLITYGRNIFETVKDEEHEFFNLFDEYVYQHVDQENHDKILQLRKLLKKCSEYVIFGDEYDQNFIWRFELNRPQFDLFLFLLSRQWSHAPEIIHLYVRFLRGFMKEKYPEREMSWMVYNEMK